MARLGANGELTGSIDSNWEEGEPRRAPQDSGWDEDIDAGWDLDEAVDPNRTQTSGQFRIGIGTNSLSAGPVRIPPAEKVPSRPASVPPAAKTPLRPMAAFPTKRTPSVRPVTIPPAAKTPRIRPASIPPTTISASRVSPQSPPASGQPTPAVYEEATSGVELDVEVDVDLEALIHGHSDAGAEAPASAPAVEAATSVAAMPIEEIAVPSQRANEPRWRWVLPTVIAALAGVTVLVATNQRAEDEPAPPPVVEKQPEPVRLEPAKSKPRAEQTKATAEKASAATLDPAQGSAEAVPEEEEPTEPSSIKVTVRSSPPGAMLFRADTLIGNDRVQVSLRQGEKVSMLALLNNHEPTRMVIDGSRESVVIVLAPLGGTKDGKPSDPAATKYAEPEAAKPAEPVAKQPSPSESAPPNAADGDSVAPSAKRELFREMNDL